MNIKDAVEFTVNAGLVVYNEGITLFYDDIDNAYVVCYEPLDGPLFVTSAIDDDIDDEEQDLFDTFDEAYEVFCDESGYKE